MLGNMRKRAAGLFAVAGVALIGAGLLGTSVSAANNPLAGWVIRGGDADWRVQPDGTTVKVVAPNPNFDNANGPTSFFVSPSNVSGTFRITMSAEPQPEESDYMGFAVGYTAPVDDAECSDDERCATGFYLFDWKKDTELEGGEPLPPEDGGQEGFSLMHVQGARDLQNNNTPDHPACFWTHEDVDNFCDVLGTKFGPNEGYDFGVGYTFEVTYTTTQLRIVLKGTAGNTDREIFNVAAPSGTQFPAGRVAFYNYSQPLVGYSFDDGTVQATTTTTSSTSTSTTTVGNTSTTVGGSTTTTAPPGGGTNTTTTQAGGGTNPTTQPSVGPTTRSSLVRTGQGSAVTTFQLLGGAVLLLIGAALTAARGGRPEGVHFN